MILTLKQAEIPMHRPVILHESDTLKQSVQAMDHNGVGSVLVANRRGEVIGIVTDRDVSFLLALHNHSTSTPLGDVIRGELISVNEQASVEEVIELMKRHGIRRIPVFSEGRKRRCVGVVTLDDLIREKKIGMDDAALILREQLYRDDPRTRQRHIKSFFANQERALQSYRNFLQTVKWQTGLPSMDQTERFTHQVLSFLIRQLPPASCRSLFSQLPSLLSKGLLPEATIFDRSIDPEDFLAEIQRRYDLSPLEAEATLHRFWTALTKYLSPSELRKLVNELPAKAQTALFAVREEGPPRTPRAV